MAKASVMRCMTCNEPTSGVELSPGSISAICPKCSGKRSAGSEIAAAAASEHQPKPRRKKPAAPTK